MTPADYREIVMALPGVEDATMYGQHAYKVKGTFLTRVRGPGESDPGVAVVKVDFFERDALMSMHPETFFVTAHYQNYKSVLVRLDSIDRDLLTDLITESWRQTAPKRLVAAFDVERAAAMP